MTDDPIMAEVRATRDRLAARFGYDVEAIFRHVQAQEARSGLTYVPCPPRRTTSAAGPPAREPRARGGAVHAGETSEEFCMRNLEWSEWCSWNDLKLDARSEIGAVSVPEKPGVYEARLENHEERLTIGQTDNLRRRVKQGLVKGTLDHSSGERIRDNERVDNIVVRWAETDCPGAVERELHERYMKKFGKLPKYTRRT